MSPKTLFDPAPQSLLYVPGHKARALEKARGLPADCIIIDLEDAVPADAKGAAREGAAAAVAQGFAGKRVAVRVNGPGSGEHGADAALVATLKLDAVVVPKVETSATIDALQTPNTLPVLAMVETPGAVLGAAAIAAHPRVIGLIAGLNDLAHDLKIPDARDRGAMALSIQMIVLGARAGGAMVFDGVCNLIDDAAAFAAEAAEGHRLGFDGKTLIHPSQIEPCNTAFAPDAAALDAARALIASAADGAQRVGSEMVEAMHVEMAKRLVRDSERRAAIRVLADA